MITQNSIEGGKQPQEHCTSTTAPVTKNMLKFSRRSWAGAAIMLLLLIVAIPLCISRLVVDEESMKNPPNLPPPLYTDSRVEKDDGSCETVAQLDQFDSGDESGAVYTVEIQGKCYNVHVPSACNDAVNVPESCGGEDYTGTSCSALALQEMAKENDDRACDILNKVRQENEPFDVEWFAYPAVKVTTGFGTTRICHSVVDGHCVLGNLTSALGDGWKDPRPFLRVGANRVGCDSSRTTKDICNYDGTMAEYQVLAENSHQDCSTYWLMEEFREFGDEVESEREHLCEPGRRLFDEGDRECCKYDTPCCTDHKYTYASYYATGTTLNGMDGHGFHHHFHSITDVYAYTFTDTTGLIACGNLNNFDTQWYRPCWNVGVSLSHSGAFVIKGCKHEPLNRMFGVFEAGFSLESYDLFGSDWCPENHPASQGCCDTEFVNGKFVVTSAGDCACGIREVLKWRYSTSNDWWSVRNICNCSTECPNNLDCGDCEIGGPSSLCGTQTSQNWNGC